MWIISGEGVLTVGSFRVPSSLKPPESGSFGLPEHLGNQVVQCHAAQSSKLPASLGERFLADTRIIAQPESALARAWRKLTGASGKQTILSRQLPKAGTRIPEEGTNNDYRLFCRVNLGDRFNNERYITVRKLGYGQYSTVWLARDLRYKSEPLIQGVLSKLTVCTRTQTHVALKILRSDCYNGNHDIFELEMLQHIEHKSSLSTHPGQNHVLRLLTHFRHEGEEGTHVCLVFPVLGHHLGLQTAKFEQGRIPVAVMKEVARQLLQGLDYLHRECGIIHSGQAPSANSSKS